MLPPQSDQNLPPKAAEMAWPGGDAPEELEFTATVNEQKAKGIQQVLAALGVEAGGDAELHALRQTDSLAGRYRVLTKNQDLFLRISTRPGQPETEKELLSYLAKGGAHVNPILATGWIDWRAERFRADIRPFLAGRHFTGTSAEIRSIADSLGKTHRLLKSYPGSAQIKAIATARYSHFEIMKNRIATDLASERTEIFKEHEFWAIEHIDILKEMIQGFRPRFEALENAQCVHGEIHPANVIHHNDRAVFVDFEEAPHTFAPPGYDLAFFVQRFLMRDQPAPRLLDERLRISEQSYGATFPPLAEMMTQICRLSMIHIIHARAYENLMTPFSEYEKFIALERQARALGANS
ncbi:aminoglycoside phosphotransferase family protein [Desulfovibrio ferrophilus]|uniref:Aminoglycoside phosphotransferase n=1 Tax=Desulfovibrio ferrophilus TaxID=241368 RepID=A0A2Z6B1K2_9BACT|nr:aminoglycoside phosphotransferase family protein [Desulfovibrio ferrophilus]BBD09320.1 aminoglycoside phosphotransferase [Desulfovibrio ferrophilus]